MRLWSRTAFPLRTVTACAVGAYLSAPFAHADDPTPPMSGGYTNVIAIPVSDPAVESIAGALFKPSGAGPFPAVIYMSGCAGLGTRGERALQKTVIVHLLSKGVATLIVDPFTPRNEMAGVCIKVNPTTFPELARRGGSDVWAAVNVLKEMADIDPNKIFLQGYSWGAVSSLFAVDRKNPVKHHTKIAGVIAYYPRCYEGVDPSVPTLVMIGDQDDWTPVRACQAVAGKPNLEVVVYSKQTHGFVLPGMDGYFLGHHLVYDEESTRDAEQRADGFMAAHMK